MSEDKEIKPMDAARALGLAKIEEKPKVPTTPESMPMEGEVEQLDELMPEWADQEIKVKIWKFYRKAGRVIQGAKKRFKEKVGQAREEADEMVKEARKVTDETKLKVKEGVEEAKENLEEGVPKAKKAVKKKTKEIKDRVGGCLVAITSLAVFCGLSGLAYVGLKYASEKKQLEESGVDVEAEQQKQEIASQQEQSFKADYLRYAKNGLPDEDGDIYQGFSPPGLDNAAHILNSDVQIQTAMRGPSWNFAMYPNEAGVLQTNDLLVERVAAQLGVSPADLKAEWPDLNADPAYALQYLQAHGANSTVTNFYQCTTDVYNSDLDKTTWQDRLPGVQACADESSIELTPEATPTPQGRIEQKDQRVGFAEVWDVAEQAGIKGEDALNNMATLGNEFLVTSIGSPEYYITAYETAGILTSSTGGDLILVLGIMAAASAKGLTRLNILQNPMNGLKKLGVKIWLSIFTQDKKVLGEDMAKRLAEEGPRVFGNEEWWRIENGQRMLTRLKAGLSLSRDPNLRIEDKLIDNQDRDIQDLILVSGGGMDWLRQIPNDHLELMRIAQFFGCGTKKALWNTLAIFERIKGGEEVEIGEKMRERLRKMRLYFSLAKNQ